MDGFIFKIEEKTAPKDAFDPHFGIRIRDARISLEVFNTYCQTLKKVKLHQLKTKSDDLNIVSMGVIVKTSGNLKSSKNSDYVIWQLNDLINEKIIKVLLFGEAASSHWKLQDGYVVAVTHMEPVVDSAAASSTSKSSQMTIKLNKGIQVVGLGFCPDFGICKGIKKDGQQCTNYVNKSIVESCDWHLEQAAQKMRNRRGAFSAVSNEPPKCMRPQAPRQAVKAEEGEVFMNKVRSPATSKLNYQPGDRALMARKARLGQALLTALEENKNKDLKKDTVEKKPEPATMKSFLSIKSKEDRIKQAISRAGKPQLGKSTQIGNIADLTSPQKPVQRPNNKFMSREKAIAILKSCKDSPKTPSQKRPLTSFGDSNSSLNSSTGMSSMKKAKITEDEGENNGSSKKYSDDRIKELLAKKSRHQNQVNAADSDRENRYFAQKEVEEKLEGRMTTLMEMKEVNVVSCKICNYTAPSAAELCKELFHDLLWHKATKRWYKCKDCQMRVAIYEKMPTKPCAKCLSRNFERVAMKDERDVKLREALLVRGEEQKFVST